MSSATTDTRAPSSASGFRSAPARDLPVALVAAGAATLIIAWAVVILTGGHARFAVLAPQAQAGVEAASALARLFAALVLFLFPGERAGQRLRWVAGGLVVLALGGFVLGYVQ